MVVVQTVAAWARGLRVGVVLARRLAALPARPLPCDTLFGPPLSLRRLPQDRDSPRPNPDLLPDRTKSEDVGCCGASLPSPSLSSTVTHTRAHAHTHAQMSIVTAAAAAAAPGLVPCVDVGGGADTKSLR